VLEVGGKKRTLPRAVLAELGSSEPAPTRRRDP
jgi:hypothetical protein